LTADSFTQGPQLVSGLSFQESLGLGEALFVGGCTINLGFLDSTVS